ncbi:uncharacterized protein FIESC28_11806 [Fusarium coffeatum]|uniref:BRCT domain-containing protein n=1 Tax=Fusarium coffeatum TaxID=231269 RepID=A0A366QDS9_9HYPO|nr:uncharacterized protein FIESC28_11806 [Fusarium coffeatum]RBR03079.1 hypothetical protein FIESC28_11806 [Fusarium coffeatum]
MPSQIFKGRVFAAAGPLPGQFTVDNLKRWTSLRKGIFLDDFDETVTHLLCTREQWDNKVPRIKQALKRHKNFPIIHCDWYEFSTVQNKRLPEKDYSMRSLQAKLNARRREKERWEKGIQQGKKFVNTTDFYHLYRDRLNFVYEIHITRDDEMTGEVGQKYTLYLWESNAKPHLYLFAARFLKKKGSTQPSYHRPSPHEGPWRQEMDLFMDFFKKKTGIDWQDRVTLANTQPRAYFQYTPPARGKPIGRRLRHDIDYCREINAEILGLLWPPVENPESSKNSTENDSDAGPRAFEDEDEVMASPPDSTVASELGVHGQKPEEDHSQNHGQDQDHDSGTDHKSPEVDAEIMASPPQFSQVLADESSPATASHFPGSEVYSAHSEQRLKTPSRDMEAETEGAPGHPILLVTESAPTFAAKSANPAPSIDENDTSKTSNSPLVHHDKETGIELSLEFEG